MEYSPFSQRFIKGILNSEGLWLSKSRGQNYLIDRSIAEKIVKNIPKDKPIFEVGTGLGALTSLAMQTNKIYSLEIDAGIYKLLLSMINHPNLNLIHADFLKYNLDSLPESELFFLSNLPYSISGEVIRVFTENPKFREGVVMVQAEFADKMLAETGDKSYGVFSVLCRTFLEIKRVFNVPRGAFFPVPGVDSVVIVISKKQCGIVQSEFRNFLLQAFKSKRKTLYNNLKLLDFSTGDIESLGISPKSRPEEIDIEEWEKLFRHYLSKK